MEKNLDLQAEIVISGISGRFPKSDDLDEFWENLINGTDMISESHDRYNDLGLKMPARMGILKNIDKFDAEFFSVHAKQANVLDPRLRKLLEVTHEAIVDAGINPASIQGSNTGVFVAVSDSEASAIWRRTGENSNVYGVLGSAVSMMANRLSFNFGFHGPSYIVDTACSSASTAVQHAMYAIRNGLCEAAIVAGSHLHHDPLSSFMFHTLEMTTPDGKCKVFDASADGYARAEAAVAIYICKKQVAKRAYATLVHAGINNDGYKEQGITFPSEVLQEKMLRKVYDDIGLNPIEVDYVEAHGTGTKVGDPEEMQAITNVFCEGRQGPLLIGSLKSNMGHPEPVAGLCAIAKLVLSHVSETIPANLHYHTPNPDIPALLDGRFQVVDKNQPFKAKYVGVNSFGFGGTNVHILLKFDNQQQRQNQWSPRTPIIIPCSGRTEEAVEHFLKRATANRHNQHFVKLLHELSKEIVSRHPYRGYLIANGDKPELVVEKVETKDSVWFIFTGMGSQWAGMSKDLIKFTAFKNSVTRSAEYLSNNGFDLMRILESGETAMFDDFKNAMVAINTIQVAIVDLLKSIGVEPGGIIGHSTGEVTAGYADGCLTQQQTVLVSLARARAFLETTLPPGTVCSVGLTWEEAHKRCPEGVFPAIYNAKENVTIAGPPETISTFMKQLESEGVFVKAIRSALYGFHSPLVHDSKSLAIELLAKILPNRTLRSNKWLSSSVPEDRWDTDVVKYCSAEYYVNNGLNPVYFYPTLLHVPENAIALEIAPHCFMLSILKQSLPKSCICLGLLHVKSHDNCQYFLNSMGQCFLNGITVDFGSLYEKIEFPVNSRTPTISPMLKWDYTESWYTPHNREELSKHKGQRYDINILTQDTYLEGHTLEGRIVFPATGYLWLVWRFLASDLSLNIDHCPLVFQNVRFERITFMNNKKATTFLVNIFHGSGIFEVLESDMLVCTGHVRYIEDSWTTEISGCESLSEINTSGPFLSKDDFYKEMHLRGYGHSGQFQGIQCVDIEGKWANIEWPGHWVSFLDSVLQIYVLQNDGRDLFVPTRLKKLVLDPVEIKNYINKNDNVATVKAWKIHHTASCSGLELQGLSFAKFNQRHIDTTPTKTEQVFVPYLSTEVSTVTGRTALETIIEISIENSVGNKFVYTEILTNAINMISDSVLNQCLFAFSAFEFTTANESNSELDEDKLKQTGTRVIKLEELSTDRLSSLVFIDSHTHLAKAESIISPGGFVLCRETFDPKYVPHQLQIISKLGFSNQGVEQELCLFRKTNSTPNAITVVSTDDSDFGWVNSAKETLSNPNLERVIFTSNCSKSGVVGFIKCLVKEMTNEKIRCFHSIDERDLNFDNPSECLKNQMSKDLVYNVYKSGSWGFFGNQSTKSQEVRSTCVYANALKMGELSSLSWIESPLKISKNNLVEVHYSSLNFKDIMLASGRLNQATAVGAIQNDCVLGLEFSGILDGKRVFGMGSSQCLATHVDPKSMILFDIPNHWSYAEAATVPAVYVTVYLALIVRGRIEPGESILIHAGSGGVGQAAIAIALNMKCKVFTTVSTKKKRDFLKSRFPSLTDECFANSRNPNEFRLHVEKHTNGRGVDLVLNSLAQESLKASIDCLGENGRFLEIGKFDLFNDTKIGLSILLKGVSIYGILADKLTEDRTSKDLETLKGHIQNGITSGVIRPLNSTVFKNDQLEEAFRFMAQGKHIGKVLIQIKEQDNIPVSIPAVPRTYFHSNKSYIIIGGLGGMGFELANWMISRGATKLVLVSRTGVKSTYHEYRINIWEKQGITILISKLDAALIDEALKLIQEASNLGSIGGIFNSAVLLKDALFEKQTPEMFADSTRCKADATVNLDVISRRLAPELDHFVVFSSLAAGRGNPGQTNYGYSNSVMERICEQRHSDGLPALAVQWGAVGDVGVLYRQIGDRKSFAGLIPQKFKSCLETLDLFLQQDKPVVSSFLAVKRGDLEALSSKDSLVDIAARILGIKDASKVNPKTTLVELGMDSLMAAELSQVLTSRRNVQISQKSYAQLTFEKLAQLDKSEGEGQDTVAGTSKETLPKLLKLRQTTAPILKMKTSTSSSPNMFIVHPLDGTLQTLETLIESLDFNIYGFECVKDAPLTSLETLAAFYLKKLREIQPDGPYILAGYSFGGSVAFEMALQLERQNEVVPLLLLLDGSPIWKGVIDSYDGGEDQKREWENAILFGFLQQYTHDVDLMIFKQLSGIETLEEKWQFMAKILTEKFPEFDQNDITHFLTSYMARMECAKNYVVSGKVRAKTVLIKALQLGTTKSFASDYGLNEVCEKPVEIIGVDGGHYCFYEKPIELGIPAIIKNILETV